jgi:DNA primase
LNYKQIRFANLTPEERFKVYSASQISLCRNLEKETREAYAWLTQTRGLDTQTISDFRLGYVPFSVGHAFSGRIVIPIFDAYSNLLALSVRPATNDEAILKEYKKYWNESYEKGWNLFGLNLARLPIVRRKFVILVEGQFDVATMHSFGFNNTVGVLGGAFTPMQAQLLKLWTDQIVVMFDGDEAGKKSSLRCMDVLSYFGSTSLNKKKGRNWGLIKAAKVNLPNNKDPDEFLKERGSLSMRRLIVDALREANMKIPEDWAA